MNTQINTDKLEFSDEVYQKLGDAITWTTILAAIHQDGIIERDERAEAIYQAHIRAKSAKEVLRPIYEHLDTHFESDFDKYTRTMPSSYEERVKFIQEKIEESMVAVREVGPVFTRIFSDDLESLYEKVFNAHRSIFQSFALPFITPYLNDQGKKN